MEQHPVPRNISGFQFKLIGDMTVRQFAYLGAGVLMAYFTFRFAPYPPILRIPLAGIIGLSGFAFAFLPVQERPLDKWLMLFIKSITSPTQYLWHKEEIVPDILIRPSYVHLTVSAATANGPHQDAKDKLKSYLSTLPTQSHERINLHEKKYMEATLSLFQRVGTLPTPQPLVSSRPAQTPSPAVSPVPTTYPVQKDQTSSNSTPVLPLTSSSPKPSPSAGPTI